MGLIIKATKDKKIESIDLDGVKVELTEVYARVECALRPNGTTIETAFPYIFKSKTAFKNGAQQISHSIRETATIGEILETEKQGIEAGHRIAAEGLIKAGFEVVIDL